VGSISDPGAPGAAPGLDGPPAVEVRWTEGYDADAALRRLAREVTGRDPGPLLHRCPTCGSLEHGVPGFEDRSWSVSLARAPGLTVVALSGGSRVGVDVEADGPRAEEWVRTEAVAKVRGTGIVVEHDLAAPDLWIELLGLPAGYVGAVAGLSPRREVRAGPLRRARP
jgi:hypothetical protein